MTNHIRSHCDRLNKIMRTAHLKLGIPLVYEEINIGAFPGDGTGDPLDKAVGKTLTNVEQILEALYRHFSQGNDERGIKKLKSKLAKIGKIDLSCRYCGCVESIKDEVEEILKGED